MSFPSAIERMEAGDAPEQALLHAMEHDTALGYRAISAVAAASKNQDSDPLAYVRAQLPEVADQVLRAEYINNNKGLKIDFDPLATIGMQIARLMGTDAARPLLSARLGTQFGYANCCGVVAGEDEEAVNFTVADQIRWQHSIDC
jgi:hypothetical protein